MKKLFALTSALALSAVMLTGCASKLEGKWTLTDEDGEPTGITVKFKDDDKVILNGHKGKWEQVDKKTVKLKGFNDDLMNGKFAFEIVNSKEGYLYIEGLDETIEESGNVMTYRTAASSLYKAINTALVELEEEYYTIDEPLIISSDSSLSSGGEFKDENGKRAGMDYFYEKVEQYFDKYDEYEFVAYIDSGMYCLGTAVSGRTNSPYVGSYPRYSGDDFVALDDYHEVIYQEGEYTLEDVAGYYTGYAEENDKD
ncbi:MAG: hypothetical protein IJ071_07305 [Ruminococcus sp.]|nr:hypothetical protein [Ruminococcus sp.]